MDDMTVDEVADFLNEVACKITDFEKGKSIDIVDISINYIDE